MKKIKNRGAAGKGHANGLSSSHSHLRKQVRNLDAVFSPKSIAVIGASREPGKIGHVILRNFLEGGFDGPVYPINPNTDEVLGLKAYGKTSDAPGSVDCAVVAVPAKHALESLRDAVRAGARGAVVITGGFSEIGNRKGEAQLKALADEHDLALIGPNCMGVINPAKRVDSVFLPIYKLGRPHNGSISFISQSGAVGGCIVDLAARAGMGMAKFVSYGNATSINETDLISYLAADEQTRVVVSYLEGVRDGREFLAQASALCEKKPLVVLKAGKTAIGAAAAASHTGAMAGAAQVYSAAFKQAGAVEAGTLDELFDFAKVFEMEKAAGKRIAIVTNGGGNGVLAADSIESEGLELATFSAQSRRALAAMLPPYAQVRNPLDLIGDANASRFEMAIGALMADPNVDALVVIVLFQTAALDSTVVNVLVRAAQSRKKPMVVVSTGGEYTELHRRILDGYGIPTYPSPSSAVRALEHFLSYCAYWAWRNKKRKKSKNGAK